MSAAPDETPIHTELTAKALLETVFPREPEPAVLDCPKCDGLGELWTGRNEPDTDAPVTRECHICGGRGAVDHITAHEYEAYVREMDRD